MGIITVVEIRFSSEFKLRKIGRFRTRSLWILTCLRSSRLTTSEKETFSNFEGNSQLHYEILEI